MLQEGGELAAKVIAPPDRIGDLPGAVWTPERVRHPDEIARAYQAYVQDGWRELAAGLSEVDPLLRTVWRLG